MSSLMNRNTLTWTCLSLMIMRFGLLNSDSVCVFAEGCGGRSLFWMEGVLFLWPMCTFGDNWNTTKQIVPFSRNCFDFLPTCLWTHKESGYFRMNANGRGYKWNDIHLKTNLFCLHCFSWDVIFIPETGLSPDGTERRQEVTGTSERDSQQNQIWTCS